VEPNKEGGYRVVAPKVKKASAVEPTKQAATARAKEIVTYLGGGEVTFKVEKARSSTPIRSVVETTLTRRLTGSTRSR
jgi:hypothetical protein